MKKNLYKISLSFFILVFSVLGSFNPGLVNAEHVDGSSGNGHGSCSGDECSSVSDAGFVCDIGVDLGNPANPNGDKVVGFDWSADVSGAQSTDIDWVTAEANVTNGIRNIWLGYSSGEDYSSGLGSTTLSPGNYTARVNAGLLWRSDVNHQGGVSYSCGASRNFNVPTPSNDEDICQDPTADNYLESGECIHTPNGCSITSFTAASPTLPNGGSTTLNATFTGPNSPYAWSMFELGSQEWLIGSGAGNASASTGAMNNSKIFRVRCGDQFQDLSVVVDGGTCVDPAATNNGGPLPCNYPPGALCTNPAATNNGGPLPCVFPSETVYLTPSISGPLCAQGSYTATMSWSTVDNDILIFVNQPNDQPGWGFNKETYGGGGSTSVPTGFTQRMPPETGAPQTLTLLPGVQYTTFIQNDSDYAGPTVSWQIPSCSSMTGDLTPQSSSCIVASGASTCSVNMDWSITNPIGSPTSMTATGMADIIVSNSLTPSQSGMRAVSLSPASRTFYLYNNGTELDRATVTAACAANTDWDDVKCAPDLNICGDGDLDPGETCDDDNTTNGDGCSSTCSIEGGGGAVCGNGVKESGEQCDDDNTTNGDGCSSTCTIEGDGGAVCGNGKWETGEQCDDGCLSPGNPVGCDAAPLDNGDKCSIQCRTEPPVVGGAACGETKFTCDSGTPSNLFEDPSKYSWSCGATACTKPKAKTPIFIED